MQFQQVIKTVRRARFVGMAAFALAIVAPMTVATRPVQAQAIQMGVVDEDKLAEGYTKYRDAVGALEKKAQDMDRQLAARELLSANEGKTFDELILKATRTEAEEKRLQEMVTTGTNRRSEYIGLVGKATRDDKENKRMKELQDAAQTNQKSLQQISDQLYNNIKQQQEATDKEYTDRANKVIEQVAGDKKLALVIRKRAAIWNSGSIEITDDVLKRLNQ